ncbi:MAG: DUF2007 domain-containing protein [Burkholderiaceae bacterium]
MHLLIRSYDPLELQRLRGELEARKIRVFMSDEFTYAVPGLPGAEQPRALWVADATDLAPARRVVADLLGERRLEETEHADRPVHVAHEELSAPRWITVSIAGAAGIIVLLALAILWTA